MHIDSARELKAELLKYVRSLSRLPRAARQLAMAARSLNQLKPQPRTIALGVAPNGREFKLAVRLQNRALGASPVVQAITSRAAGEVDIRYIGRIVKRVPWGQERQRPLLIGSSIGHYRITAGTLCCFVRPSGAGALRLLSNNHVLAEENNAKKGDAVIQPGRVDGGTRGRDTVAVLDKYVRLSPTRPNFVDAATATIQADIEADLSTLRDIGVLKGVGPDVDQLGGAVVKVGRTTGVTRGLITAFELDNVIVGYDMGNLRFDNQIEIEGAESGPFSQGGDSGSLIVDEDGGAVALLFAGGDTGGSNGMGLTYGNPIPRVLDALTVELAI